MRILLLVHALPLDAEQVVTGNAVRAFAFEQALTAAGHTLRYAYPAALGTHSIRLESRGVSACGYDSPRHLERQIHRYGTDVVFAGYWELLEDLPDLLDIPIVLDMVAPRLLESMFEESADLGAEARRMVRAFRRPWRFLVGSSRQRDFLIPFLLMAGVDCSAEVPVDVVPIAMECADSPPVVAKTRWRFVTGGVEWPWRDSNRQLEELELALAAAGKPGAVKATLLRLGGVYQHSELAADAGDRNYSDRGLLPYAQLREVLAASAVGVELATANVERHFSQSFRAVECLCAGIPLLIDDYLELAAAVREFDAGWIVDRDHDIQTRVREILSDPAGWARKAENALRLARAHHDIGTVARSLMEWLKSPSRPGLGNPLLAGNPVQGPADNRGRVLRELVRDWVYERFTRPLYSLIARVMEPHLQTLDGPQRAIVLVTRRDIFPPNHGAAVKIERTAWALSFEFDQVVLITDDRSRYHVCRHGNWETRRFPIWVRIAAPPRFLVRLCCVIKHIPLENAFLYFPMCDRSYNVRTLYAAMHFPVLAFQAEFPAYVKACLWAKNLYGRRIVMVEHNVEYQRIRNQVPKLSAAGERALRKIEIEFANACNAVVTVSENDRQQLLADGVDGSRMHVIPHGVDLQAFSTAQSMDLRARYSIAADRALLVYHGTYEYQPNLEAVQYLAREIVPRLRAASIHAHIIALGRLPLRPWAHECVTFTGPVEALAPYLCAADVAAVPLLDGGGTRMKVLDYFAAGIPVVITSKGIEGIPVVSGEELLIEDEADGFAEAVAKLLKHPELARKLTEKADRYVQDLDWRILARANAALLDPRSADS